MELFELETQDNVLKLEVSTKAWKIDLSKIKEGWLYSPFEHTEHGETKGKAKAKLWSKGGEHMELSSGKEMTFTSMPVIRAQESDLYLFEGKGKTKHQIDNIIKERKRRKAIDDLIDDNNVKYCYIIKRGAYYGYNYGGYVYDKERAGVYPKLDARLHALGCNEIELEPVDVEIHNDIIRKKIEYLQGCKIKK